MRKTLLLLVVLAASITPAFAGWTRAGLYGADVRAMVEDPRNPERLWLGTSGGEIYISENGGREWEPVRATIPFPGYVVDNLIVDRSGRLWASAWGVWGGGAVAVSGDGGRTWSRRDEGVTEVSIRALAVDPANEKHLVLGGLDGVWMSRDDGKSWNRISDHVNVESLAIDPRKSQTIYVGTWRQAWRTDDGGRQWKKIDNGMVLDTDVFNIHLDPRNPDSIWIATCGWVYNTKDRGDLWTRYRDGFENRRIHDIVTDPSDVSTVYAGSVAGLYKTSDAGKNWARISDDNLVINTIIVDPRRPDRILLGTEGDGVYVSHDRGQSFQRSSVGLYNVKITSVVPDPRKRDTLYAVVYFGGAASGIWKSADAGRNWSRMSDPGLPEVRSLLVRREAEPRFIAGTERGLWTSNDGKTWRNAEPSGYPLRVERVVAWSDSRLFAGTSDGVFTTRDGGASWYRLNDFANGTVDIAIGRVGGKPALYALTEGGMYVFDGAEWGAVEGAPMKGRRLALRADRDGELVLVAGFDGVSAGLVDATRKWRKVPNPGGATWKEVLDGTTWDRELVALFDRNRREILLSSPGEPRWTTLAAPVEPSGLTSISGDPFDADTLYVATSGQGVFIYRRSEPAAPRVTAAGGAK